MAETLRREVRELKADNKELEERVETIEKEHESDLLALGATMTKRNRFNFSPLLWAHSLAPHCS